MPSPFPGMDPWLEDPGGWLGVHNSIIAYLSDDLNAALAGRYVTRAQERVVGESPVNQARGIYPDLFLLERRPGPRTGGTALAEPDAPIVVQAATAEFREAWLEIRDRTTRKLITVIELLSPSNKTMRGGGRKLYLKKQREVLASDVNLVEVDLLRGGTWTLAVPEEDARSAAPFDYLVSISRPRDRSRFEVHPILLPQRLPRIAVPLAGRDPDAVADLPSLIRRCYDRGQYRATIDYSRPPVPPLSLQQVKWASTVLRRPRSRKKKR